jgi:hypothetical protein
MKLIEVLKKVREENLTKEQLEDYFTQLSGLFADLQIEMAELEKEEAIFMAQARDIEISVAQKKIMWKSQVSGQRLIMLKRYSTATNTMLRSLKNRIYALLN